MQATRIHCIPPLVGKRVQGRSTAVTGLWASLWLFASWLGCGAPEIARPNLVLVTAEVGRPVVRLCEIGKNPGPEYICVRPGPGVHYRWALTPSSNLAPAVTSILTSTYPSEHGVQANPAAFLSWLGPPPVAETLFDAGYTTAAFLTGTDLNRSRQLDRGFATYSDEGPDQTVVDRALSWMDAAPQPWFMWIHLSAPDETVQWETTIEGQSRPSRPSKPPQANPLARMLQALGRQSPPPGLLVTGVVPETEPSVGGSISQPGWPDRDTLRVPLFWQPPRSGTPLRIGREIKRVVSQLDAAPTLLHAAGLPAPAHYQGTSLPEDPRADESPSTRTLFAENPEAIAVIHERDLAIFPIHGPTTPGRSHPNEPRHPILLRLSDPPFKPPAPGRLQALSAALGTNSEPSAHRQSQ